MYMQAYMLLICCTPQSRLVSGLWYPQVRVSLLCAVCSHSIQQAVMG